MSHYQHIGYRPMKRISISVAPEYICIYGYVYWSNFKVFLGDLWSYNANHNEFVVSPQPDVCVVDIDVSRHRCLIFGTDGLWNALSPSTAVAVARTTEKNNEEHHIGISVDNNNIDHI